LRTAVTYAETQSVESLRRYFERQKQAARASGASKADQRMVSEPKVREAVRRAEEYDDLHPKFRRTRMLLAQTLGIENGERVIVFTESRDTAETLTDFLNDHFSARKFVGQSDTEGSDGMTQNEQQETLDAFRAGEFEVLVSTSVAEEGLDVPEVDLVLFYEPVPTAIRAIQRKGRTGRQTEGKVSVLLAEDTRDEAYFWKARRDQKQMREELQSLKSVAGEIEAELGQTDIAAFEDGADSGGGGDSGLVPSETEGEAGTASQLSDSDDAKSSEGAAPPETGGQAESKPQGTDSDGATGSDVADSADSSVPQETGGQSDATTQADGNEGEDGQAGLDAFAGGGGDGDGGESGADGDDDTGESSDEGDASEDGNEGDTSEDGTVATAHAESDDHVEIVVDQRELDAAIAKDLSRREGIQTRLETLAVGDYVLSDRVVVERKTVADFLDTLTGGDERSMFEQLTDAARNYARPVVVVEGGDLYGERNVHPNAIRGALASLTVDFGASVLQTADEAETTELLETIATREQEESDRTVSVHGEKSSKTLAEQQEYVVASVAEVGPVTARSLLDELGSVEAVMTADSETLQDAEGVGEVTAERIREVVASEYDG
jgi:Fanconi anemia group M protein